MKNFIFSNHSKFIKSTIIISASGPKKNNQLELILSNTFQELISMYLLTSLTIAHNAIFHISRRFFLILQTACAIALFSFPTSYASEHGATVFTVPVTIDDFPNHQEALETLLHHKTGLQEPRVYTRKAFKCCKNVMQLTPSWLKNHYGTLPLSSVRKESTTQVQLSQFSLSQAIELIESDECKDDVSFVSVLDKNIATTLKTCNHLSSLSFQGTRKSSINLLENESRLCPLNYEKKEVPITLSISLKRWKKIFMHHPSAHQKTHRQLSRLHKKFTSAFSNASLTLPTHITFLDVSNKHHVEYLHQNMPHVSNVIVQIHGQQQVVLMPPISEQYPHYHLLDSTGQFLFKKEIDLSASESVLNNDSRLAHATLYSAHLNSGDVLFVPANWFIYRKSLNTSVSMSLNYLSGDQWCLSCFHAKYMQPEDLAQKKRAIKTWAGMEIQKHPNNRYRIAYARKNIQATLSNVTQQVLDLSFFWLRSLPDAIFRIPHLKTLNLYGNHLTSFSLSHMKNLVSLDLSCNNLTSFSLSHMENLASLNLYDNKLDTFSCSDLPSITHITLRYNCFFRLGPNCISSMNTHQHIKLDLRNNPLSYKGKIHIQKDLSQRIGSNVTDYPIVNSLADHIHNHRIKYEDFVDLLSRHNIFPSPKNGCLICPITHETPHYVIFFIMNKCYKMYDADAFIQWIRISNSQVATDPLTREPATFNNLISAKTPCVLEYFLKQH